MERGLAILWMLVLLNGWERTGVKAVCNITQAPKSPLYKIVNSTFTLEWQVELDPAHMSRTFVRLTIGAYVICNIKVVTGVPDCTYNNPINTDAVIWTGNLTRNVASFLFSNVTHDMSVTFTLEFYRCGTSGSSNIKLKVVDPPRFNESDELVQKKLNEGQTFTETCTTIADPPMIVKWIKLGDNKTVSHGNISSTLTLDKITKLDGGNYICLGTNEVATINRSVTVTVLYPRFIESNTRTEIGEGQTLIETCTTIADPPMTVKWIKNDDNRTISQGNISSTFTISKISRSDSGTYTCLGTNEVATINRIVSVHVVYLDMQCTVKYDTKILLKIDVDANINYSCAERINCPGEIALNLDDIKKNPLTVNISNLFCHVMSEAGEINCGKGYIPPVVTLVSVRQNGVVRNSTLIVSSKGEKELIDKDYRDLTHTTESKRVDLKKFCVISGGETLLAFASISIFVSVMNVLTFGLLI